MTIHFSNFSQSVAAVLMACVTTLALALPSPKDIEAAVNAGHNAQAEAMLREVIQEKPQSAKAHYELGQVLAREARYAEAQTELKKAKEIDPALKFAANPDKFNDIMDKVSHQLATTSVVPSTTTTTTTTPAPHVASPTPVHAESGGFSLTYVWLGIGALVVLALVLRRSSAPAPMPSPAMTPAAATPPRGFGAQFTPNAPAAPGYGPGYGAGYPPGYGQPAPSTGSTVAGAVVGGLAGVAAGYALSKALEGDHHSGSANTSVNSGNNGGYVPFDTPAQPDLGSFDAGSGDTWDDASSSGGDDSW